MGLQELLKEEIVSVEANASLITLGKERQRGGDRQRERESFKNQSWRLQGEVSIYLALILCLFQVSWTVDRF